MPRSNALRERDAPDTCACAHLCVIEHDHAAQDPEQVLQAGSVLQILTLLQTSTDKQHTDSAHEHDCNNTAASAALQRHKQLGYHLSTLLWPAWCYSQCHTTALLSTAMSRQKAALQALGCRATYAHRNASMACCAASCCVPVLCCVMLCAMLCCSP